MCFPPSIWVPPLPKGFSPPGEHLLVRALMEEAAVTPATPGSNKALNPSLSEPESAAATHRRPPL